MIFLLIYFEGKFKDNLKGFQKDNLKGFQKDNLKGFQKDNLKGFQAPLKARNSFKDYKEYYKKNLSAWCAEFLI